MSFVITAPAPIVAPSPMHTGPMIFAFAPTQTDLPTIGAPLWSLSMVTRSPTVLLAPILQSPMRIAPKWPMYSPGSIVAARLMCMP